MSATAATPPLPLMFRLLPWAAVLLPSLILALAALLTWRSVWRDAQAEMLRSADAVAEYGSRVINSHVQFNGRVNDLLRGLSDAEITAQEARLHTAMAQLLSEVPQASASFVLNSAGEPLVSSLLYPVPRGFSGESFQVLAQANAPALHISRPYLSRFDSAPFFAISRRREGSGNPPAADGFDGIVNVMLRPRAVAECMRRLLVGEADRAALIRADGQMLVHTRGQNGVLPAITPAASLPARLPAGQTSAVLQLDSPLDGQPFLLALRQLEGFPVFAAAGRPRAAIVAAWRQGIATQLLFGLPATLALLLYSRRVGRDHGRLVRTNTSLEQRVAERTAALQELSDALDLSATFIKRPDGTILHWSLGCERLYGYSNREMMRQVLPPLTDYRPGEREAILAAVERDGEWRGELRQRHKDGTPMVVLSHWIARQGPDGMRLVLNQTDITSRTRLQAALADSEARFRATFEQAAIGMAHVALDGRWLRVNDQLCAMLGYGREEMLRGRFQDITHPDDLAPDMGLGQRLLSGELNVYSLEKRYRRKDGGLLWAALTVSLMHDERGRPLQFIAAIADITARKLAEAALTDSEHRLRLAQEAAGIGTWEILELDGELRWSPQAFTLFGWCPATPQPRLAAALARLHPADQGRVAAELAAAATTGEFRSEFRVLQPLPEGGTRQVWLAALGRRLPAAPPHALRLLGVYFDITERKQAEEHSTLLMREVDHRAKNALAVVQAALRLTRAGNQADYIRAVEGRVAALARAHTVLAQRRWQGAELRAMLEAELLPFLAREEAGSDQPRAELHGPAITLEAAATQALCMALHELATNAVKYGALSQPGGVVSVSWSLAEGQLRLTWRETGGPVTTAPARRGFGSRVIEKTVQGQLGGVLERYWTAAGLVVEISVPHGPEGISGAPLSPERAAAE